MSAFLPSSSVSWGAVGRALSTVAYCTDLMVAYQKAYYASKIKNDAAKMRIRREKGRARRRSKSMIPKKVPLQGVSQENDVEMQVDVDVVVDVARFRLF